MAPYKYTPLNDNESMRTLTILPVMHSSEVTCLLVPRLKHEERKYDALSYAWGGEKPTESIRILSQDQSFVIPIIPNLKAALQQLRHPERNVVLWVDAICINQEDKVEKSQQVPKMAEIYSEAENVRVWLGKEEENKSERALKFIRRILDFENFDRLIADDRLVEDWAALLSLMKRPWFGRRWVVQEVALAKRAFLHCGKDYVSWEDFADAMRLFEERQEAIEEHFLKSPFSGFRSDLVADIKAMNAIRLVHATSNLFRKSNEGQILERLATLETLVSELSPFEASDPRDTIYSVLALAKDTRSTAQMKSKTHGTSPPAVANGTTVAPDPPTSNNRSKKRKQTPSGLASRAKRARPSSHHGRGLTTDSPTSRLRTPATPNPEEFNEREKYLVNMIITKLRKKVADKAYDVNYTKSFFTVCKDFLKFVIQRSQSLDILCRPWAPTSLLTENPPSWVRTMSTAGFRKRDDGSSMRINADPLVGGPGNGKRNYSASRSYPAVYSFGDWMKREDPKSLRVMGFVLDKIERITRHPAMSGDIPAEWPRFAGWTDASANPPMSFWMTLIAGRGPDGMNPPGHYQRACKYAFTKKVPGGPLDVRYLLRHPAINSIAKEFLKRMQSAVWMRRLMLTRRMAILGLVPDDATEGDCVCIVFGCSVPVILREHKHDNGLPSHFEFIGECYVDGMMDGEAMEQAPSEGYRTFELH